MDVYVHVGDSALAYLRDGGWAYAARMGLASTVARSRPIPYNARMIDPSGAYLI